MSAETTARRTDAQACAAQLQAALARHGISRQGSGVKDDFGGLGAQGVAVAQDAWVAVSGRLSTAATLRLAAMIDAAAWRRGVESATPEGTLVPRLGWIVIDPAQADRPGRVMDWDGRNKLTLHPPSGFGEWSVPVDAVRAVPGQVRDARALGQ
jgi:hypothetical protein